MCIRDSAGSVSLSREQFCRFFKKSFRSTPISYLNRFRINRSMALLKETSLPVIDIAIAVGFDSSNYFAISFRKATGMTPSQYRNCLLYTSTQTLYFFFGKSSVPLASDSVSPCL